MEGIPAPHLGIKDGYNEELVEFDGFTLPKTELERILTIPVPSEFLRLPSGSSVIDPDSVLGESGRYYHGYKDGKYFLPNDEVSSTHLIVHSDSHLICVQGRARSFGSSTQGVHTTVGWETVSRPHGHFTQKSHGHSDRHRSLGSEIRYVNSGMICSRLGADIS